MPFANLFLRTFSLQRIRADALHPRLQPPARLLTFAILIALPAVATGPSPGPQARVAQLVLLLLLLLLLLLPASDLLHLQGDGEVGFEVLTERGGQWVAFNNRALPPPNPAQTPPGDYSAVNVLCGRPCLRNGAERKGRVIFVGDAVCSLKNQRTLYCYRASFSKPRVFCFQPLNSAKLEAVQLLGARSGKTF